ncbi:acetyltransferase, GNAT family [Phenylobacterium zucineum HLK1]|uniref:Acetyltransferase, GNAT family n=1 Tax=Phenylobacterium zucineum (strain HLK1) TaxID=450851 RepID=B4R8S3_PHEZH|nr:N-acetyltransferase [Phenylobacterium zucineum]ACG79288.1 acetyltransferase, GNAT family [Phenylobacterium zucineum HLK1]
MSAEPCAPPPAPVLTPEDPADAALIEALLDRAFGPGRLAKSSERVREFADFAPELSFCAREDGRLAGVVRMWRVNVGETPVVFLGPLAVEPELQSGGVGGLLVQRACAAAKAAGEAAVLLVGDPPYFARFGFEGAPDAVMPGPVDRARVLALRFADVALSGPVRPR